MFFGATLNEVVAPYIEMYGDPDDIITGQGITECGTFYCTETKFVTYWWYCPPVSINFINYQGVEQTR